MGRILWRAGIFAAGESGAFQTDAGTSRGVELDACHHSAIAGASSVDAHGSRTSLRKFAMKRKRVVVLGATGSIGESAAKVARDIPERVEIVGIAANSKARELAAQANELRPPAVCIVDETKVSELRKNLSYQPQIFSGETGLREIASGVASDMVLVAIVGTGGLRPALAAIEAGKDLAVASKEILVMAGEIVMRE